jgi:FdhD protein
MKRRIQRFNNGVWESSTEDVVAVEEPLEIRIQGRPIAVTMRSPGSDIELALGFLTTEGVIDGRDDVHAIASVDDPSRPFGNSIDVVLSGGVPMARTHKADRRIYASSSCGLCGKESIERIVQEVKSVTLAELPSPELICRLPTMLRSDQPEFAQTGGIHAAGLFHNDGTLVVVREDIGRHNAVDKAIGHALERGLFPCSGMILVLSGRAGFELVQKAAMADVSIIVAIGAPSSLAVDLANRLGMWLIGFTRGERFNVYSGGDSND